MSFAAVHRNHSTPQDLARVLCGWLVAVLLLHGLSASLVLVRGAAHRHVVETSTRLGAGPAASVGVHAVAHAEGTPHHHSVVDALAIPADGAGSALDAATLVLVTALVSMAAVRAWADHGLRHALPAYPARWLQSHTPGVPHKPPRG